ncbi:MAG: hypothetical protein ACI84F_001520 [Pseudoalteromonas tetraodonis]|jgi:hypothetical protein
MFTLGSVYSDLKTVEMEYGHFFNKKSRLIAAFYIFFQHLTFCLCLERDIVIKVDCWFHRV